MLAASGHAVRQIKLPKRVTAFFYFIGNSSLPQENCCKQFSERVVRRTTLFYIIISIIISLFYNKNIIIL